MDNFDEMLHAWQTFYFMAGGTAAALIGLMFVAVSLSIHVISKVNNEDMKTFATPSVIYFVSALLLSCIMLIPALPPTTLALILFLGGVLGMVRILPYVIRLINGADRYQDFNRWDWLSHIISPVVNYILIGVAALGFAGSQWALAFNSLWIATVLLVLSAIANTWSLVVWSVGQQKSGASEEIT